MKTIQMIWLQRMPGARMLVTVLLHFRAYAIQGPTFVLVLLLASSCYDIYEVPPQTQKSSQPSSGASSQGSQQDLIGTWNLIATETSSCSDPQRFTCYPNCLSIVFKNDGTFTESNGSVGTYRFTGDYLEFNVNGNTETYRYSIGATILKITRVAIGNAWNSNECYRKEYMR